MRGSRWGCWQREYIVVESSCDLSVDVVTQAVSVVTQAVNIESILEPVVHVYKL